ncbi:hypothetical protein ACIBTV_27550 [Micromonospora sp. NPDC049366]|uniref:hypothetical protein n=1 Tax=Micromonospora sp. NPDC049366 TaxID=3364271 RepID=UPI0037907921
MTMDLPIPDAVDLAGLGERVCGATDAAAGLTCARRPHAPGTPHYRVVDGTIRAWRDSAGDARDLLALIELYAGLREAAPGESECGSPVTAERLQAAAVTVEAEIRARLGLTLPGPDAEPVDLLDLGRRIDSTGGCPISPCCAACDTTVDLTTALVVTPVGVACTTVCWDCDNAYAAPKPGSLEEAYAAVLLHAEHLDVELPHLASVVAEMRAAAGDGCPKCQRLHFPWCHPYGGPGYTRTAIAAQAGEETP